MTTGALCGPGETRVIETVAGFPRWCFACRRRLPGTYRLIGETAPSYYEPWWRYACDGCGGDGRLGFGCDWLDGAPGPSAAEWDARFKRGGA